MVEVNLIPKEYKRRKEKISTVFSKTGGVVLALFVLSLLLYGGLLLYQSKLKKDLDNIKAEIVILEQKRDPEMEKSIIDLDKKLGVVKELFESHLYWSKLFSKIEESAIPEAYFSKGKVSFLEDKVNVGLSGNTLTYTTLAKQVISFQEDSLVEKVKISGISLANEGGIDFDLEIIFSKDILLNHD